MSMLSEIRKHNNGRLPEDMSQQAILDYIDSQGVSQFLHDVAHTFQLLAEDNAGCHEHGYLFRWLEVHISDLFWTVQKGAVNQTGGGACQGKGGDYCKVENEQGGMSKENQRQPNKTTNLEG